MNNMTTLQGGVAKYANNPLLRALKRLPALEAMEIRNEYPKAAYDKLSGEEQRALRGSVLVLSADRETKFPNLGETGALQLLAAIGQLLDSAGWPEKDGGGL